jgi:hypothetical protein
MAFDGNRYFPVSNVIGDLETYLIDIKISADHMA